MRRMWLISVAVLGVLSPASFGDSSNPGDSSGSSNSFSPTIVAPDFNARLSLGFNYDFLTSPTRVPFDYPRGYIGLNIPISWGPDQAMRRNLTSGIANQFAAGKEFDPRATAQQNANTTVRVDVPMMGGVASFANIQNFYFGYTNTLGEPSVTVAPALDSSLSLLMKGMIAVPLQMQMGWETMTFGYAYKVNKNLIFAMNLNRHIFRFDLTGKANVDLLGYIKIQQANQSANIVESKLLSGLQPVDINYTVSGTADGHYQTEVWTPTFGLRLWRFNITSRLGIDTRVPGYLDAKYTLPFFIDPQTFAIDTKDLSDPTYLLNNMQRFINNETDSIEYKSTSDMIFRMPQGHTISFDIIRDKLFLSYTKFFGQVEMKLPDITTIRVASGTDTSQAQPKKVDFDVAVKVDNIILLQAASQYAFLNMGVFSMDVSYDGQDHLLGNAFNRMAHFTFAGGAMVPVLNFGTTIGAKLRLLLEVDVLPLAALKTGVVYYF